MTTLAFPDTAGQPTDGSFTYEANGVIYSWTGDYWAANNAQGFDHRYVNADGDQMTGDLTVPSLNGGPLAGMRNQLINGDFRVRQFFNNGTGSNKYITDRWCTNDSTTGSTPDVTDVNGASKGLRLDGGSRVIRQVVELPGDGLAGPFYNGSQWTMSIYSTVAPAQLDVRFCEGGVNIGTSVQITGVPGWTATTDVQGSFTRYTCTFNVNVNPDSTSKGFRVSWSFASAATFTLAQLEPGPVATPFEQRPIGTELALCQRYYFKHDNRIVAYAYTSGAGRFFEYQLPTTMRIAPNITIASNTNWAAGSISTDTTVDGFEVSGSADNISLTTYVTGCQLDAEL